MATPTEAISFLIKTMNATSGVSAEVKAAAAEGLGHAGGVAARDALISVISATSGVSVVVKSAAAIALGRAASD